MNSSIYILNVHGTLIFSMRVLTVAMHSMGTCTTNKLESMTDLHEMILYIANNDYSLHAKSSNGNVMNNGIQFQAVHA